MSSGAAQHSILVVDDTAANIGFLLDTLSKAGYRVRIAPDGESALEQLHYSPPDLVLLDVMMPGIDSFETCRRLGQLPNQQKIQVIFISTAPDAQENVHELSPGPDDKITKTIQYV